MYRLSNSQKSARCTEEKAKIGVLYYGEREKWDPRRNPREVYYIYSNHYRRDTESLAPRASRSNFPEADRAGSERTTQWATEAMPRAAALPSVKGRWKNPPHFVTGPPMRGITSLAVCRGSFSELLNPPSFCPMSMIFGGPFPIASVDVARPSVHELFLVVARTVRPLWSTRPPPDPKAPAGWGAASIRPIRCAEPRAGM